MKEKLTIVKVGGAVVEDEAQLSQLLKDFSAIEGKKVLVHGGGRMATKVAEALGIESKMLNGRRITDAEMLSVVTMVYGGLVNKNLVARLQANGVNALGLTGADMDVIRSHKRPIKDGVDFGFVGDVDKANGQMLSRLIEEGVTPVMAPLTHEKGVLRDPDDEDSVISTITRANFIKYKADGTISGGMLPKIENALAAIDAGVSRVVITLATALDGQTGTTIC